MLKYIDWNIKNRCNIDEIIRCLKTKVSVDKCIVALQEVLPKNAEIIKAAFSPNYSVVYSIDYHPANDDYDTDNRKLGVMFIVSNDITLLESGVFERCIFPERTLYATLMIDGVKRKIVNFHSITGVSYKMAKAAQFRRLAESVNAFRPDILSMDANEPRVDHYDISQMEFFSQNDGGKGAKLFFDELNKMGLVDLYAINYNPADYEYGSPLAISHIINNKTNRRYDHIFVNGEVYTGETSYFYEEACKASSDHAIVISELKMKY